MLPAPAFDFSTVPVEQVRAYLKTALPSVVKDPYIKSETFEIAGADGQSLQVYSLKAADATGPLPTVLAFHGGGGLIGTPQ